MIDDSTYAKIFKSVSSDTRVQTSSCYLTSSSFTFIHDRRHNSILEPNKRQVDCIEISVNVTDNSSNTVHALKIM